MFAFLRRLFGGSPPARQADDRKDFEALNRHAPVKASAAPDDSAALPAEEAPGSMLCREAVLGRDQKVAGYHFLHSEGTRHRLHNRSRRIRHIYAEVLVRTLSRFSIDRLLGHRLAFVEVPDSFLGHASLAELDGQRLVLVLESHDDDEAPETGAIADGMRTLKARGVRFGLICNHLPQRLAAVLPLADFLIFSLGGEDPAALARRIGALRAACPGARILMRDLASFDEFHLGDKLGASHFQGAFVTSREPWKSHQLGPSSARLADLLARLKRDADTRELADILKRDGALSVRLLRYINSAAVGLPEKVTSFERALALLGRDRLHRWLTLLMLSADGNSPRSAAVLEGAMVRARMMELLGENESAAVRDELFMAGLLSLIDVVLEMPLAEAMVAFAPSPAISAAILDGEGRLADLLELARACESHDADALEMACARSDISLAEASRCHAEALAWALEVSD